ncbi:MAG: hypothetical protein LBK99_12845 [Opitutaceae bacterium]|nr:hypothetical protein [Opitutaceae bacterium]
MTKRLHRLRFPALVSVLLLFACPLDSAPAYHILFIGDSITHHNLTAHPGWEGNRRIAASRAELNYVHRLVDRLGATQSAPPTFTVNAVDGNTLAGKLGDAGRCVKIAADISGQDIGDPPSP